MASAATHSKQIRVAILEDHQSIIDGYTLRLTASADIKIVGAVMYGEALEALLAQEGVDVLLLDVHVPQAPDNPNPYPILHVIPRLLQQYPALEILVISMFTDRSLIRAILEAGASGYILKDDQKTIQNLAHVVCTVAEGGVYFSSAAYHQIRPTETSEEIHLSPKQKEAISMCATYPGKSLAQLAQQIGVQNSTLRNHLSQAYLRLGVSNRTEAILKARTLGLITPFTSP